MKRSPALLVLPLVATLALSACGSDGSADDGKPTIAASFYPYAFVAEQVGGDRVTVDNLTQPGGEPHDLELAPKQVAEVQEADLVVYQHEFQPAVDDAVDQADRAPDTTVDVADLVTELDATAEEEGHHDDEEGHEDEAGHDDHDHGDHDPHTWLDPNNMIVVAKAVSTSLSEIDPDHAGEYAANADRLIDELSTLDSDFSTGLQTCERRTIVTAHAAFAYLAARYDLTQESIAGIDPGNEPSPADLADITKLVRSEGITTIFTEEHVSPAIARTVANETGATTAVLSPIEGLTDDTADETYLTLMRQNLDALRQANSCQ